MTAPKSFYRLDVKLHSLRDALSPEAAAAYRAAGRSVSKTQRTTNPVRSMAYRSGTEIADKDGELHDFTQRWRVVERSAIIAPKNAPEWVYDRQHLWEEVRGQEKRVDARWMQEVIASLAYGLNAAERWLAATKLAEMLRDLGMIIDYSIHRYGARIEPSDQDFAEHMAEWKAKGLPFLEADAAIDNDEAHVMIERDKRGRIVGYRLRQPHIHLSMPTRSIGPGGFGLKPEEWYERPRIRRWRHAWQDVENEALETAGRPERVDCRTLKVQGIDRKPQVPHGLAKRIKKPNEKIRERLEQSQEIADHNIGLDIGGIVQRVVMAGLHGGPAAAVLTGLSELGLLP